MSMPEPEKLEDDRGVDVAHIPSLLALTPAQRLAHMVDVVTTMRSLAEHAKSARAGPSPIGRRPRLRNCSTS
jgi:hypothetical protein